MDGRKRLALVVVALTAIGASSAIAVRYRAEEERAKDTVELGAARAQLTGLEARAWLEDPGATDVDPETFGDFPLYGASEVFQEDWGALRRAVRVRVPSADPLRSADAVLLGYGSCLPQLGTCDVGLVLVVTPACRRPRAALLPLADGGPRTIGDREVLRVDADAVAPVEYPGRDRTVDVLYLGDVAVEAREGSTAALVRDLVPLNPLARAPPADGGVPTGSPDAPACADPA